MYNRIVLLGRLAVDPELRFTQTGFGVCTLRLAVDGPTFNKQEKRFEAIFVNVIVWNRGENRIAERCNEFLAKGRMVLVEGKLNIRSYEAQDGTGRRYVTEVIADNVKFVGGRSDGASASQEPHQGQNTQLPGDDGGSLDFSDFGMEVQFEKDNLPF